MADIWVNGELVARGRWALRQPHVVVKTLGLPLGLLLRRAARMNFVGRSLCAHAADEPIAPPNRPAAAAAAAAATAVAPTGNCCCALANINCRRRRLGRRRRPRRWLLFGKRPARRLTSANFPPALRAEPAGNGVAAAPKVGVSERFWNTAAHAASVSRVCAWHSLGGGAGGQRATNKSRRAPPDVLL